MFLDFHMFIAHERDFMGSIFYLTHTLPLFIAYASHYVECASRRVNSVTLTIEMVQNKRICQKRCKGAMQGFIKS